jgi:uncharacterized membrane protein
MKSALTVWRFDSPPAADAALPRIEHQAATREISVHDAAVVSWPTAHRKPQTRALGSLTGPGELWGGFWGLLLGLIFLVPIAGPALGAAAGALAGSLSEFGVEDDFVKRVRDAVTPGTSALFLLTSGEVADRLGAELRDADVELIRLDLSREHELRLREVLGDESALRPTAG